MAEHHHRLHIVALLDLLLRQQHCVDQRVSGMPGVSIIFFGFFGSNCDWIQL